jgi:guanyl-specific ribonuclease Sa
VPPEANGAVAPHERMAQVQAGREQVGAELRFRASGGRSGTAPAERLDAQRRHATRHIGAAVQRKAAAPADPAEAAAPDNVHAAAEQGISGDASSLPHLGAVQQAFGKHDIGHIQAHVGPEAQQANAALGAKAYATGDHVAFGGAPDLHTVAHEAAHVIQQREGVHLAGGVGRDGDEHERHADAVADRVVRGQSAEALLDAAPGRGGAGKGGVQQKSASTAVQFAKPADKSAAQALASGAIKKKPPKLKKGERAGGFPFGNYEGRLPKQTADGKPITYTEYDVNGYDGVNRGAERVVVGSDGRCWYTSDHYGSFVEVK